MIRQMIIILTLIGCGQAPGETDLNGSAIVSEEDSQTWAEDPELKYLSRALFVESLFHFTCSNDRFKLVLYEVSSSRFYLCDTEGTWRQVRSIVSQPGSNDQVEFILKKRRDDKHDKQLD